MNNTYHKITGWGILAGIALALAGSGGNSEAFISLGGLLMLVFGIWGAVILIKT